MLNIKMKKAVTNQSQLIKVPFDVGSTIRLFYVLWSYLWTSILIFDDKIRFFCLFLFTGLTLVRARGCMLLSQTSRPNPLDTLNRSLGLSPIQPTFVDGKLLTHTIVIKFLHFNLTKSFCPKFNFHQVQILRITSQKISSPIS